MDLQTQIQALIEDAPADQATHEGMQVVATVLGELAQGLGHTEYYVLQSLQQQWQITTLQHRSQEALQKTVLYAYGSLADATRAGRSEDLMAVPVQVVPLLFQFFSFEEVDSLLFLDEANNPEQMRELKRQDLQALVQAYLEQFIDADSNATVENLDNIA
jgi:hypothetical protein